MSLNAPSFLRVRQDQANWRSQKSCVHRRGSWALYLQIIEMPLVPHGLSSHEHDSSCHLHFHFCPVHLPGSEASFALGKMCPRNPATQKVGPLPWTAWCPLLSLHPIQLTPTWLVCTFSFLLSHPVLFVSSLSCLLAGDSLAVSLILLNLLEFLDEL